MQLTPPRRRIDRPVIPSSPAPSPPEKAAPADTRAAPDTGGAAAGALLDSKLDSLNTRLAGIRNAAGLTTGVRSELQGLTSWINRFRGARSPGRSVASSVKM